MDQAAEMQGRVAAIKERAHFFMAKRRKDGELYAVLADALALCEYVDRRDLVDVFREEVAGHDRRGRNRVYTERATDVYGVVGRAVFEPELNRGSSWRYCSCLREAAKRQITSNDLVAWLNQHGGLNTLFKTRGVLAKAVTTKTLHLNQPVTVDKEGTFTLTLRRDARGFFDVVDQA